MPLSGSQLLTGNIILLKAMYGKGFSGRIKCKPNSKFGCKDSKMLVDKAIQKRINNLIILEMH
jgi:hypothetical protein